MCSRTEVTSTTVGPGRGLHGTLDVDAKLSARSTEAMNGIRSDQNGWDMQSLKVLEQLLPEMCSLLELLEQEKLSDTTQTCRDAVLKLLRQLKPSDAEETEYIYTSSAACNNGLGLWQVLEQCWRPAAIKTEPARTLSKPQIPLPEIPQAVVSVVQTVPIKQRDDAYEVADPLTPDRTPQYIMYMNSEGMASNTTTTDAFYEEADEKQVFNFDNENKKGDSDMASSSYESYDEEEEEEDDEGTCGDHKDSTMTRQWPSEEASMHLVKDSRICGFLLRKKRFGQWSRQLCVIKENRLLCYKSSKEQQPQLELPLGTCDVAYVPKDGRKRKHELRLSLQGSDSVVLAAQSYEQAEEWLKIIQEVCGLPEACEEIDSPSPSSTLSRTETDKSSSLERNAVLEDNGSNKAPCENGSISSNCDGKDKGKRTSLAELKDSVSKATGKKITRFMTLGRKKKTSDEPSSSEEEASACGYLQIVQAGRWREHWCRVRDGMMYLHRDKMETQASMRTIPLHGCQLMPGTDPKHPYAFRLLRDGQETAMLQAGSAEEMIRWLGLVLAEVAGGSDPVILPYDYVDIESLTHILQSAQQPNRQSVENGPTTTESVKGTLRKTRNTSSLDGSCKNLEKESNGRSAFSTAQTRHGSLARHRSDPLQGLHYQTPSSPTPLRSQAIGSSASLASAVRDLHNIASPKAIRQQDKKIYLTGRKTSVKEQAAALVEKNDKSTNSTITIKRNSSNAADPERYGKNRAQADARRYQTEKETLEKRKEVLRELLVKLKDERKEIRSNLEKYTVGDRRRYGKLKEQLQRVEDQCRSYEQERVKLELKLTEVKENLNAALSGGPTLGVSVEPKVKNPSCIQTKQNSKCVEASLTHQPGAHNPKADSLPVNSALMMRQQQKSIMRADRGHVMLKAKEWEKKGTN
uniref:actin filament-associated protein 1 n=1 Tax=Myxine glutinosa TaxID=7769 RepID=UPI00358F2828